MDLLVEDEPAGGGAALTGGPERAPQDSFQRQVEVGVVHHDHRVLAAHLQRQPLVHPPAGLADQGAGLGRTGERDDRHVGVLHQRLADGLSPSVHQLDHLGRQPGLQQDLDQQVDGVRHVFRRLDDHGVSAHQRGEHLPGGDGQREVERRDQADQADRPAVAHRPLGSELGRDHVTEEPPAFGRRVVGGVDSLLHVAAGLRQHLPHLTRHGIGDRVLPLDQQIAHAAEHVTPDGRGGPRPHREAALRRAHRGLDVPPVGVRESSDQIRRVRRIPILEVRVRRRCDPLAADVVLEGLGHE